MNAAAANALYEAERKGVRQIKGDLYDSEGGRCAMGVLNDAGLVVAVLREMRDRECPLCGNTRFAGGLNIVAHLNDDHGLTFAEIARKLGPDAA